MNSENQTINSIDDLLDMQLDDLADMPEFKPFPDGVHRVILNFKQEPVNNIPTITIKLTAQETLEATNPAGDVVKQGDTTNVMLMLKNKNGSINEFSQGTLKLVLGSLAPTLGTTTTRETLEAAEGIECAVVTKQRANKSDPNDIKWNTTIVSCQAL